MTRKMEDQSQQLTTLSDTLESQHETPSSAFDVDAMWSISPLALEMESPVVPITKRRRLNAGKLKRKVPEPQSLVEASPQSSPFQFDLPPIPRHPREVECPILLDNPTPVGQGRADLQEELFPEGRMTRQKRRRVGGDLVAPFDDLSFQKLLITNNNLQTDNR